MAATTPWQGRTDTDRPGIAPLITAPPAASKRGAGAHPRGLRRAVDIGRRVMTEVGRDRIQLVAASCAFYALLALFPALAALVSIYGLVADPGDVEGQLTRMSALLPGEVRALIDDQMRAIVGGPDQALSTGLVIALLGALWAASGGMQSMITAINIAFGQEEKRNFFKLKGMSIALTLAGLVALVLGVLMVGVLPALFDVIGLGDVMRTLIEVLRWPALALLLLGSLSLLYKWAPCRPRPHRWVTWGSAIATALCLAATGLFSVYVSQFGKYNETYGAIGGVVILLLWLFITSFVILLGAEIDAELEEDVST